MAPLVGALFAWVLLACESSNAPAKQELPLLTVSAPYAGHLAPAEHQHFALPAVQAGDYLDISLTQKGVDLRFTIEDEKGRWLADANRVPSRHGKEKYALRFASPLPSSLTLRIWSDFPLASGDFVITLHKRVATAVDTKLALAYQKLADGQFHAEKAGESLTEAILCFRESSELFADLKQLKLQAMAIEGMARSYDLKGDNLQSSSIRLENIQRQQRIGDTTGRAYSHYGLGRVFTSTGEIQTSIAHYEVAQALATASQNFILQGMIAHNIGDVLLDLGEFSESKKRFAISKTTFERIADQHKIAIEMVSLSEVATELGNDSEAMHGLLAAEAIFRKFNLKWDLGRTLQMQAQLIADKPELASTETSVSDIVSEAIKTSRQAGDKRGELASLQLAATLLLQSGDPQRALTILHEALALATQMQERISRPSLLRGLGLAALAMNTPREAQQYFSQALPLAKRYRSPVEEARILSGLAQLRQVEGKTPEALQQIQAAIAALETIRFQIVSPTDRSTYFNLVRPLYDLYIEILMNDPDQYGEQAFVVSEQARARTLLEGLAVAGQDRPSPEDMRTIRISALRLKQAEQEAAFLLSQPSPDASAVKQAEANIAAQVQHYQELNPQSLPTKRTEQKTAPYIAQLQQALPADTLLIEFAITDTEVFAWTLQKTGLKAFALGKSAPLRKHVRTIRSIVAKRGTASGADNKALTLASMAVSEQLIAPLLNNTKATRLLLVPDGALLALPFSLLPAPNNPEQFLIDLFSIEVMPIARFLTREKEKATWTQKVAVLADPVFSSGDGRLKNPTPGDSRFARLRFTKAEAKAISTLVPSAMVATDFAANQSLMLSDVLEPYRIVHLATHAIIRDRHPELSGLVLSQVDANGNAIDGMLRLYEIYGLKLSAQLVVLSACETALGTIIRGEGYIGLTRAFLFAGASKVMASLWRVEDKATAALMKLFYTELLAKNHSPADALRNAQRSMKRIHRWKSPYFWASFQIITGH